MVNNIIALSYVYVPDSLVWDRLAFADIYTEQDKEPIYTKIVNNEGAGNISSEFFKEMRKHTRDKVIITAREVYGNAHDSAKWIKPEYLNYAEVIDLSYILTDIPPAAKELYDEFRVLLTKFSFPEIRHLSIKLSRKIDSTGVFEFRRDTPYCTKGIYNGYRMTELPDEYYEAIVSNPKEFPEELRIIAKRALQRIYPAKTINRVI